MDEIEIDYISTYLKILIITYRLSDVSLIRNLTQIDPDDCIQFKISDKNWLEIQIYLDKIKGYEDLLHKHYDNHPLICLWLQELFDKDFLRYKYPKESQRVTGIIFEYIYVGDDLPSPTPYEQTVCHYIR